MTITSSLIILSKFLSNSIKIIEFALNDVIIKIFSLELLLYFIISLMPIDGT